MIGSHFDILWSYVKFLKRNSIVEEQQRVGISDDMLKHILKNYSWIHILLNQQKDYGNMF